MFEGYYKFNGRFEVQIAMFYYRIKHLHLLNGSIKFSNDL